MGEGDGGGVQERGRGRGGDEEVEGGRVREERIAGEGVGEGTGYRSRVGGNRG